MRTWMTRGLALGALHAVAHVAVAAVRVHSPETLTLPRTVALAVLVLTAAAWAFLDRSRTDWLPAAVVAGLVAGLLGVAGQALLVDATSFSTLGVALTGGAAFTALLVLVPATIGRLLGRRRVTEP
ncbi:hypothetical protein NLX83_18425 [Allokutzneria sp. A3M-2-11 16]|uniref:hypothetical protein n=1 Tax=Allokutzneria sp. A3M-2-11 16 TaxID=2962043 RepID=UPI0020B81CEF|nr:hypothetical protein [Allokutzneria sp. A3M-2-11 16]MCP3801240.1 hypothetical protein [Allokutzneria sp. A3M-2-11 16]